MIDAGEEGSINPVQESGKCNSTWRRGWACLMMLGKDDCCRDSGDKLFMINSFCAVDVLLDSCVLGVGLCTDVCNCSRNWI